jgi:hypothetical protein
VGVLIVALCGVGLFVGAHLLSVEQVSADVEYTDAADARRAAVKRREESKLLAPDLDGPVPRQAERMREASGLALVMGYARLNEAIKRRPAPASVDALIELVSAQGLLPPGVVLPEAGSRTSGVLAGRHATIYVRYRVEPFGVEVVSIGNTKDDGAAILIRLPYQDDPRQQPAAPTKEAPGVALFVCDSTEAITIPPPFSSPASILTAGWQPDRFHSLEISQDRVNELNEWIKRYGK